MNPNYNITIADTFIFHIHGNVPHLWIVVAMNGDRPILVNLTSMRHNSDRSAIFSCGDHPFIKHESVARFSEMQDIDGNKLVDMLKKNVATRHFRASPDVVRRLQEGALLSPFTEKRLKALILELLQLTRPGFVASPEPAHS